MFFAEKGFRISLQLSLLPALAFREARMFLLETSSAGDIDRTSRCP
jgi:hypothetical protein